MADKLQAMGAEAISEYAWLIATLANQGIEIDNDEKGEKTQQITDKKVMLYLSPAELINAKDVLMGAIADGMGRKIDTDGDDEQDEVLNEIKNIEGAADK